MAQSHVEAIELDHRPGSVDQNAEAPGKFPFAAWEFTQPGVAIPKITLKDEWRFAGHDADFLGSLFARFEPSVKTDNYAITDTDRLTAIVVNAATAKTMTLPTLADNQGRILAFVNKGAGEAVIDGEGAETVQGFASLYLASGSYLVLMGEVSGWKRIAGPLQSVSGEPSLGTPHPRGSDPGAWNVNGISSTTYTLAAPYTWDLSGSLPVGAKAVEITLYILRDTTLATSAGELYCWQYELGASPAAVAVAGPKGLIVRTNKAVASDYTYDYLYSQNDGKILLGPSRKLYLGFPYNTGHVGYAMWKFYYS